MSTNPSSRALSPNELRRVGIDALVKSLGPLGMARFIQQFETGKGNYTKERAELLDSLSLDTITAFIEDNRN
jgi:hypothetical protein